MDHIQSVGYSNETGEHYLDFDWDEFVDKLFSQSPKDPFTFRMEFLTEIDPKQLSTMLGSLLIKGAKQLYNKEIAQLEPTEIDNMQKYLRSIGFEAEYVTKTQIKYIPELKKTMPVNFFQIDFKPCSQLLNNYNKPDKLI